MKKFAKITGIVLLALVALLIVAFLLVRFVFRDQAARLITNAQKQERVELLRTSGAYTADPEADFRFIYVQDSTRAHELRRYFRLDTLLSPTATTWDNTLAVARFVASNIPHANQSVYPEKSNATALWEYHLNIEPAFNCRLHSILLHELLLSADITNRFVTCMPADSLDSDCHVVNTVWLPELQKWAMIDSDMQAYITDASGIPLSLGEMRRCYMNDTPITVHQLLADKNNDYYTAYWAKNLYWFSCWEQTGYDKETQIEGRMIYLTPDGFTGYRLRDKSLVTTDEHRFWAKPEAI